MSTKDSVLANVLVEHTYVVGYGYDNSDDDKCVMFNYKNFELYYNSDYKIEVNCKCNDAVYGKSFIEWNEFLEQFTFIPIIHNRPHRGLDINDEECNDVRIIHAFSILILKYNVFQMILDKIVERENIFIERPDYLFDVERRGYSDDVVREAVKKIIHELDELVKGT